MALEHRAQRQQVVGEAFHRALALAAHLEAADRPGEGVVGIRTLLQLLGEVGEFGALLLGEAVTARAGRGRPGGDPAPGVLAGRREGERPEADAADLEHPHHADQLAKLVERRLRPVVALLGDGEELRLPGGAAHAFGAHRLDRRGDRVGADDPHPVRAAAPAPSTSAARRSGRSERRRRRCSSLPRRGSRSAPPAARGRGRSRCCPPRVRRRRPRACARRGCPVRRARSHRAPPGRWRRRRPRRSPRGRRPSRAARAAPPSARRRSGRSAGRSCRRASPRRSRWRRRRGSPRLRQPSR